MFMGKYGIGVVLFIMIIVISIMEPAFRSAKNFINVATQVSINGMISYGMCLVITTGGIDLSAVSYTHLDVYKRQPFNDYIYPFCISLTAHIIGLPDLQRLHIIRLLKYLRRRGDRIVIIVSALSLIHI